MWRFLRPAVFSHFPGSPRIGEIDTRFDHQLLEVMREGKGSTLVDYSVEDLLKAGDTEFLNWMVVVGAWAMPKPPTLRTCQISSPRVGALSVGNSSNGETRRK